jgi:hypothetical protein
MRRPVLGVAAVLALLWCCLMAPFVGLWLLFAVPPLTWVVWTAWGDIE